MRCTLWLSQLTQAASARLARLACCTMSSQLSRSRGRTAQATRPNEQQAFPPLEIARTRTHPNARTCTRAHTPTTTTTTTRGTSESETRSQPQARAAACRAELHSHGRAAHASGAHGAPQKSSREASPEMEEAPAADTRSPPALSRPPSGAPLHRRPVDACHLVARGARGLLTARSASARDGSQLMATAPPPPRPPSLAGRVLDTDCTLSASHRKGSQSHPMHRKGSQSHPILFSNWRRGASRRPSRAATWRAWRRRRRR